MSVDPHPRYILHESSPSPRSRRDGVIFLVLDSWYGYEVVASSYGWNVPVVRRRAWAEARCADLNAEHDAWLAAA